MLLRSLSFIVALGLSTIANAEPTPNTPPQENEAQAQEAAPENAPAGEPTENTAPTANPDATETNSPETTEATEGATPDSEETTEAAAAPETETKVEEPKEEAAAPTPVEEPAAAHSSGSHFTVEAMWTQSSGPVRSVLGTLMFMLIAAMGVGLERLITLQSARSQSRKLAGEVGTLLGEGKINDALSVCKKEDYSKSYLGHLLAAGLAEFSAREDTYGIDAVERAIEKNSITETSALNKGLNILATVGSTAPFVGLVGTIFGIINAFGQIGAEGGADLTTLAPAIGEALITTAFGIIVAIVGVWLFNFFTAMIGDITNDMAESASELIDWCHKRIMPESKASK